MSRAVLFDVDGVIVHGWHARPEYRRLWNQHLRDDLGIDPQAFSQAFIRQDFARTVIPGEKPLIHALDDYLGKAGYPGSPLELMSYWFSHDSQLNRPLVEAIKRVQRNTASPFYLATNQEHVRAFYLWHDLKLGHLFNDMFYAARMGAKKPQAEFFDAVQNRLPDASEKPLLFDDTPAVVEAARNYGWEAVLYADLDDFTTHPWVAALLDG